MKIIISETSKEGLNSISNEEFNNIKEMFLAFNINPSAQQVLSIIDASLYSEIKQWGVTDPVVSEVIFQQVINRLTNGYRTNNDKIGNHNLFIKEVFFEARQKRFNSFKKNNAFVFTNEEKEKYIDNKLAYFNKIEKEKQELVGDKEALKKRKEVIYYLMKQDHLDSVLFEQEITKNNISLTNEEMDAFILKFSKQNKKE